eukprot:PLAT7034.4.p2 GENE.PLAT7034.4~~PLAT7034.4.p2  ORF type:complete len:482 (+),score=190.44 PLAT7034.4:69-1514(+)
MYSMNDTRNPVYSPGPGVTDTAAATRSRVETASARPWQVLTVIFIIAGAALGIIAFTGEPRCAQVTFAGGDGYSDDTSMTQAEAAASLEGHVIEAEGDAPELAYLPDGGGPNDISSAISLNSAISSSAYDSNSCSAFCAACVAGGGGPSCLSQCAGCSESCKSCVRDSVTSGTCIVGGVSGLCVSTLACSAQGGTANDGICAAGSTCCTSPAVSCADKCTSGQTISTTAVGDRCNFPNTNGGGICREVSTCAAGNGVSVRGLCAGPSNIRCCSETSYGDCTAAGQSGVCRDTSTCTGTSTAGLCPGPTGIQCCTGGGGGGGGGTTTSPPATASCSGLGSRSTYKAYRRGSYIGTIQTVKLQGKNVEVGTACAFKTMSAGFGGRGLTINSGFRTMAQQEYLYNCYRTKRCNNGNLAARPGYSNHQNGIALDLSTGGASGAPYRFLKSSASRYGFVRTVGSEIWHWEYRPGSRCNAFVNYSCT